VAARARIRRAVKRHRDLVWITTIVQASVLEATPTDIALLVLPADWSITGGMERCTLLGMRGWLCQCQTTVGTAADATGGYGAIYKCGHEVPLNTMDPSVATEYADNDVFFSFGCGVNSQVAAPLAPLMLDVKSKRKLTSADTLRLAYVVDADTATPRVNVNGVVRSLLQLDT